MSTTANPNTAGEVAPWHAMSTVEVSERLATNSETGLAASEASARLQKFGPNQLPEGRKRGPFMRLLSQFNNILVYVLLGAGFVKLMLNVWVDAAIILAVVILNGLLGFVQEGKAEKALESIRNMLEASPLPSLRPRVSAGSKSASRKSLPLVIRNGSIYFSMRLRISRLAMALHSLGPRCPGY